MPCRGWSLAVTNWGTYQLLGEKAGRHRSFPAVFRDSLSLANTRSPTFSCNTVHVCCLRSPHPRPSVIFVQRPWKTNRPCWVPGLILTAEQDPSGLALTEFRCCRAEIEVHKMISDSDQEQPVYTAHCGFFSFMFAITGLWACKDLNLNNCDGCVHPIPEMNGLSTCRISRYRTSYL